MALRIIALGEFIAQQMDKQQYSNRALAAAAGISEGAVRNVLKYGTDANARDPDAKTLGAIAEALSIDPIRLFKLAGYLPAKPDAHTPRAEFVADVFDRLPDDKQAAILGVLDAMAADHRISATITAIKEDADNPLAGFDLQAPNLLRVIANELIAHYQMTEPVDVSRIQDEAQVYQYIWRDLPTSTQQRVKALIQHKLSLDYDPTMVDPEWRE